jgi:replicative DNA helicase
MVCSHARVNSYLVRTGRASEEELQQLVIAAGAFREARLFIDEATNLSWQYLDACARRMKEEEGIELIVVDGVNRLGGTSAYNLKQLARELDVPVLVTVSVRRAGEYRRNHRPWLCDIRDSGAIEEEAEAVFILFREDYYEPDSLLQGVCEINVAKNRSGLTSGVSVTFLKHFSRFENRISPHR